MGFHFRRSFTIAPGIRLNVGKRGVSTSIGPRGATVNLRGSKVRTTVGVPGTGVSYSEQGRTKGGSGAVVLVLIILFGLAWVFL